MKLFCAGIFHRLLLYVFTLQPPIPNDPDQMTLVDSGNLEVTLRKGFCHIFNFKDFPGSGRNWDGSEKDVSALQNTFSEFGAKIRTRTEIKTSTTVWDESSALELID